jgi:kumamolisin
MSQSRHELPGSFRKAAPDATYVADVDPSERIELTLVLRRRAELDPETIANGTLSSADLAERFGADPADVDAVRAALPGIEILGVDTASRRVRVSGTAAQLADLFGAKLTLVRSADPSTGTPVEHRQREGALSIPASLAGIVVAVLGLDDRPQARAHLRVAKPAGPGPRSSYTPLQLASVYSMPAGTDGTGQTLAIIELGGGFGSSDLNTYFAGLGLPTPSVAAVGVDGATNVAGQDPSGADGEVLLDIEVAGAIVPKTSIVVYFAPNTDAGFLDAVSTAAHAGPTPAAISISWGQSEDSWTGQARDAMDQAFADAAALGITVTAASGDNGSNDRVADAQAHVDFPAASPHVLACGGTSLRADPSTGAVTSETVWNDGATGGATGGGVSDTFPLPAWQANAQVPNSPSGGRGVPDVAADADPQTGYQVFVDGTAMVIGGTSAVAPLWAALVCRLAQSLGTPLGLIQPKLYAATSGFRDITQGNNGAYQAGQGWDACTGLGVPVGDALLTALRASPTPPRP